MEYKINAELVSQVLNVIASAKGTGLNFLETSALLKQLQQLPKIEVEAKAVAKPKPATAAVTPVSKTPETKPAIEKATIVKNG